MSSEALNNLIDHATFREQIAAALAGGLNASEQSAFDAHAAACEACANELDAARKAEERMTALFASATPIPGFEDRVIQRLRVENEPYRSWRLTRPKWNWRIHPAIGKAAAGVAAVIVLGALGYVATQIVDDGSAYRVKTASNLRQIGQATIFNSNENEGTYPRGGRMSSYSYEAPTPGQAAQRGEWKLNDKLAPGFAVRADVNHAVFGPSTGLELSGKNTFNFGVQAGKPLQGEATKSGNDSVALTTDGAENKPLAGGSTDAPGAVAAINGSTNSFYAATNVQFGDASVAKNPTSNFGVVTELDTNGGKAPQDGGGGGGGFSGQGQVGGEALYFKPAAIARATKEGKDVEDLDVATDQEKSVEQKLKTQLADADGDAKKSPSVDVPALMPATPPPAPGSPAPAAVEATTTPPVAQAPAPDQVIQPAPTTRKVIRNGQVEFEVDRFDSAFAQVSKLTTEAGGYVGTTDSEKLPNGKVKGTVTVRVPPDRLDTLVLQLRGIGDLKSQKLEAQDISKHYSDMDSELRAAKAMEERLLAIIKEGKGQIKDLLAAEKELGNWRTKIEQLVGEMKYYDNLVALSTLNITLYERDIKTPATAYENETIDSGVEAEDVEKTRADALKAIEEAKGRVIQSDLKRFDAGQFAATIVADVPADNAGPMLDRLKQLGKMARLDVQRKQTVAENAPAGPGGAPLRVEKRDTRLNLSLYNLANVAPRQTITLNLAADDVEAAYRAILTRVTKAGGRVITSNLARNKPEATTGTISFEVPMAEADAVKSDVQSGGETMKLAVNDNPDVQNSTAAKRGFSVSLASTASIAPRETATLQVAAVDVVAARDRILQASTNAGAASRVLATQLNANDQQNVTATIDLDVHRGEALAKVEKAIADAGQTISRVVARSIDTENTLDSKVHLSLTLALADKLPPREMTTMAVELSDVESAMGDLSATAQSVGGRTVESNLSKSRDGQSQAHVVIDVPLDKAGEIVKHAKDLGAVRAIDSGKNLQVPAGPLAKARIDVMFGNAEAIVTPDKGMWASIRHGLSTSVAGLMWSLWLIVVGMCFVVPWALVLWVGWRGMKWWRKQRRDAEAQT